MNFDSSNDPLISMREIVLERARVRAQLGISRVLLERAEIKSVMSDTTEHLILSLEAEVLREKILSDTQCLPFTTEAPVPQAEPRRRRAAWLALGFAIGLGLAAPWAGLMAAMAACLLALIGAVALAEPEPKQVSRIRIRGEVDVPCDYYLSFPENTIAYPPGLGSPVRMMELQPPVTRFVWTEGAE